MLIQYYLADGQEISYQTLMDMPTMEDVSNVALMYAEKRRTCLPQYVFVSARIYANFMAGIGIMTYGGLGFAPVGQQLLHIHTAVGPLAIQVMPWASDTKLFLIGNMDDFERYDVDKIFEDVVLKDCERV